jgi:hypothetical protein
MLPWFLSPLRVLATASYRGRRQMGIHRMARRIGPSDGLDEPLILRGLLQIVVISTFFVSRYFFDVLLSPNVFDAVAWGTVEWLGRVICALLPLIKLCYAPLVPFWMLHLWNFCSSTMIQRLLLLVFSCRLTMRIIMSDDIVIGRLTKGDAWRPLVKIVRFIRISSGRSTPPPCWKEGCRYLLCITVPWIIRLAVLAVVYENTVGSLIAPPLFLSRLRRGGTCDFPATRYQERGDRLDSLEWCTSYIGQPLPCSELHLAREFNSKVMPSLQGAFYREIRRAMTNYGLHGSTWHVGHACPDPSKITTTPEDQGWNLFAQHAADNVHLGHCLVSCAEAEHMAAFHVECSRSQECTTKCDDSTDA